MRYCWKIWRHEQLLFKSVTVTVSVAQKKVTVQISNNCCYDLHQLKSLCSILWKKTEFSILQLPSCSPGIKFFNLQQGGRCCDARNIELCLDRVWNQSDRPRRSARGLKPNLKYQWVCTIHSDVQDNGKELEDVAAAAWMPLSTFIYLLLIICISHLFVFLSHVFFY